MEKEKKIYAVDFDGTLYEGGGYGAIGEPRYAILDACRRVREAGNTLILNTCRHSQEDLREAVEWCREYGVEFDYINENQKELIERYGDCRKIGADYYIDDRNLSFKEFIEMARDM